MAEVLVTVLFKSAQTMAKWLVHTGRKDLVEEQVWTKDGSTVKYQMLWRSGTWYVTTSDDNEPNFEADKEGMLDMGWIEGPNIEESEFHETIDGCWEDWEFSNNMNEVEQARVIEGWEDDTYEFMEEDGWMLDDTYYYAHASELTIEPAMD